MNRKFILTESEMNELLSYKLTVQALEEAGVEGYIDYGEASQNFLDEYNYVNIDEPIEEMKMQYEIM